MERRPYHLGRRQPAVDRTAARILVAARRLVAEHPAAALSVAQVARQAGVSRVTVYNRFGSRGHLVEALAPPMTPSQETTDEIEPREALRRLLSDTSSRWAADPSLFRNLTGMDFGDTERDRRVAERLAQADQLRPGCSIKEAEDVIGALASFSIFDRLHRDGRRSPASVSEILIRLASSILVA